MSFEETLQRHAAKPNREDFSEQDMRRWGKEKDFIDIITEKIITEDLSVSDSISDSEFNISSIAGVRVGKFGLMRKAYLENHRRGIYSGLLLSGKLKEHLLRIQEQAEEI